ncbi:glycosyltransferase [Candidatus Gottesmanbacteria bacterium]|nr:glycosyltransferase [Candidatus Gottesmanbacteria bacterium]
MRPFFSIVIPTLNEEKFLPKLLRDLSKQIFKQFEVIIVDGNSNDRTKEISSYFSHKFPNLSVVNSSKRNVSYQRNLGAKKSSGKYLVFFDADVKIPNEFLEGIYYQIHSKKIKFLTTWFVPDSMRKSEKLLVRLSNIGIEMANIMDQPFVPGFNTIVKKSVFQEVNGYRENITISEDHDFARRVCKKGYELVVLREPKLTMSLRRFRSEGTLEVLLKYMKVNVYFLINGPITKKIFDYPMGGHIYQGNQVRKRSLNNAIDYYISQVTKLQKHIEKIIDF